MRPAFPDARRQVYGVLLMLFAVVALDLFSAYVFRLPNLGLLYFGLVLFVTFWAGLPAALIGCSILAAQVWIVYHYLITV